MDIPDGNGYMPQTVHGVSLRNRLCQLIELFFFYIDDMHLYNLPMECSFIHSQ